MKKCLVISLFSLLLSLSVSAQEVAKVHRVKWYESIESISRKYGISVESILIFNNIENKIIKSGQQLLIPTSEIQRQGDNTVIENPAEVSDETVNNEDEDAFSFVPLSGKARAALILPLDARSENPSTNYLDFYSGFLTAVNDLKDNGLKITLTVIDLSDYEDQTEIFSDYDFKDFDFVVGPASAKDLPLFADYCKDKKVPIISPMDTRAEYLAEYNKFFIQAPSATNSQIQNLVKSINYSPSDKIILLSERGADTTYCGSIRQELENNGLPYKEVSYGILDGRGIDAVIKSKMSHEGKNHIIIGSEKEAITADMVRNANILAKDSLGYKVSLYCSQKLRNFESIEVESFHSTNTHISLPYYIDYNKATVRDFVRRYRALYNCEPTAYAFQGYDIASYFFSTLDKYGKRFIKKIEETPKSLLQSNMRFIRKENGGVVNNATVNIIYNPGYRIVSR